MKPARPPRVETRRAKELEAELFERARAWIASWGMDEDERDFGRALLRIAARFGSEVAERLDRAGEKARLGFLDWLAVRGEAARPARVPVVFTLADSAREARPAPASTRLQVEAGGASVILETESEVLVLPRGLQAILGADGAADAFFLAPPGMSSLAAPAPLPTLWQLKSFASAGAARLQLDPQGGLAAGMVIELGGREHRIVRVDQDIVTLDPPLGEDRAAQSAVTKVTAFAPFDPGAHNRQEHALYLGHAELFDIEAAALIEITGAGELAGMAWHYWGKRAGAGGADAAGEAGETGWQELPLAPAPAQAGSAGIVLAKPAGPIEMLELAPGRASRWIRASAPTVAPAEAPRRADAFRVRINCVGGGKAPAPDPADGASGGLATGPAAEGMANTTPLVLGNVFFPLGKEPRQFDAFYLGSQEAFSKQGALVTLTFDIGGPDFASLTGLRSGPQADPQADRYLAGVAADGQLHLFEFSTSERSPARLRRRASLRPPAPAAPGAPAPQGPLSVALDPRPPYRVPVWAAGGVDVSVAVAAGGAVWVWRDNGLAPDDSGWMPLGEAGRVDDPGKKVEGLVYLAQGDASGLLFALRDARLFACDPYKGDGWDEVTARHGPDVVAWAKIAPVGDEEGECGNGTIARGLVGVSTGNRLYGVEIAGAPLQATCTLLLENISPALAPVAVRRKDDSVLAVAMDRRAPPRLVACRTVPRTFDVADRAKDTDEVPLPAPPVAGAPLDLNLNAATLAVAVSLGGTPGSTNLASWLPFAGAGLDELFRARIPGALGAAAGGPTLMPGHVLVPASNSQVLVASFDLRRRIDVAETLATAVIAADAGDLLAIGDRLAFPVEGPGGATAYRLENVNSAGVASGAHTLYEFALQAIDAPLFVYRAAAPVLSAKVAAPPTDQIEIGAGDPAPAEDALLLIDVGASAALYRVRAFDPATRLASLDRTLPLPSPPPATLTYVAPEASGATVRPMLHLDPDSSGKWPASLLDRIELFFPGATPAFQQAAAYGVRDERPELVVLAQHWSVKPPDLAGKARFIVDGAAGKWRAQLGDTSSNPELSWEYWNGKGWWKLDLRTDTTLFLKRRGQVEFKVPADIAASDWAGKTNYWVRARLVGGDYGQETVTVTTLELGEGRSTQTVNRSPDSIRAPSVARLRIAYTVCDEVTPSFVLVRDSGSLRDQSDANRTGGALVEAFVPLAQLLGRLGGPPAGAVIPDDSEPGCQDGSTAAGAGAAAAAAVEAPLAAAGAPERAIYLGFDAPLLGEPVKLLLLVEERAHEAFAPMSVEALVAGRFVPVVAHDTTRALGESGVLSLAFPVEPTPRELFGQPLSWLRLRPAPGPPAANWRPKLLGAYLNGVWACAAETLTRELLGSSQGEPHLTLYLARPPVLRDSLELRVKEPLGEEELAALAAAGPGQVLGALENLPGYWVLWRQVTDPGDEGPGARVYALDEASGEIRFGDGRHGMIPPIGRDAIVAMTYRRTEAGAAPGLAVPGNAIAARTTLNLVSPIDGVEAVVSASQSAGGAPPEDTGQVLRFSPARLRHRGRALTVRDIEDLVLARFPDIAQARCFRRQGFVELVAVKQGADPVPGAAQLRELHRMLLAAASPLLGGRALRVGGPALRRLRVDLRLRVASLDDAGVVAREARKRIAALLDAASGGVEGDGWPLGDSPAEADVAFALADVARLEGIAFVALREIGGGGGERPWPDGLAPHELAVLARDGVRIAFETVGVAP